MECLLIGGCADGRVLNVNENIARISFAEKEPVRTKPYNADNGDLAVRPEFKKDEYIKEALRGEKDKFYLFRHSKIGIDEMIYKLISNYRP